PAHPAPTITTLCSIAGKSSAGSVSSADVFAMARPYSAREEMSTARHRPPPPAAGPVVPTPGRCHSGNRTSHRVRAYSLDRWPHRTTSRSSTPAGAGPAPKRGMQMATNDDDITTSGAQGEGTADGGSNPGGHDGGADGSASAGEGTADGGSNPGGHDGGADGSAGEGTADGGSNPDGHDGGADGAA